jgi:pyruvate formate lyase activating enzyme
MYSPGKNISKREFLRRSVALSAGVALLPCSRVFSHPGEEQTGIYKRLAMFQEETPGGIMCRICPNECVLREGQTSRCRSKKVYKSQLYTLAFGNPCSIAVDPVEKKPLYHFLPGSRAYSIAAAGCNLACLNCQNWTISQSSPDKTRNYDLPPEKVVEEAVKNSCASIAYTYSEPTTFYEYVFETATIAREKGIKNIVKSNGYINPGPLKKLCTVIDGANIDLKSFNETTYLKLSGGKLQPVLESLKVYRDAGVWLEITNLMVPSWTDKLDEVRSMCRWLNDNGFNRTPIHFSRFYPLHKLEQLPPTPVETLRKAHAIAIEEGLKHVYLGNAPGSDLSDTFCTACGTKAVIRQGYSIAGNNIREGKCGKCDHKIEGVWS